MNEITTDRIIQINTLEEKPAQQNAVIPDKVNDPDSAELNRQSQRIQELIEELENLPDDKSKIISQECLQEIVSFYGKGIERILNFISKNKNSSAADVLNNIVCDNFVSGLLLIHDLHPLSLEERLKNALQKVRPYMDSHGGSVEIVSLHEGIAKLRLSGSCKGCPSSALTLELGIKQAIEENCPDLLGLEVEGAVAPDNGIHQNGNAQQQLSQGWKVINGLDKIPNNTRKAMELSGISLIIFKVSGILYAYRNLCPACDLPLTNGTLDGTIISCHLGHKYDIQKAGRCTDDADLHLDPFPLLEENGTVKISIA